ncbi:hypothetical protein L3Q82_011339 [Scortum barcoo]|uniref:Uncharacterized protein n=1 Tax=Scortum barcoo TaxID=214431 RepID=A0ACB8W9G8_9TELE|nr:hypothetical protein L3Q82_011339 [Scortum barcoo]
MSHMKSTANRPDSLLQVRTQLKKIKARKATGPDGISSRLLRDCADQLCQSLKLRASQGAQPLQTRGLNVSPDEGTGEDRPQAPPAPCWKRAGASDQLAAWVTNYLTDRPQFVRLQDCVSDVVVCSTGRCPPGNSPLTFPLHPCTHRTSHTPRTVATSRSSPMTTLPAIVGCVSEGNDCEYRKVIMDFVDWCELNHLQVNASKTKEMVIDFSR